MLVRLPPLLLLGAVCACDAPPKGDEPAPAQVREQAAAAPLPKPPAGEPSEQCGQTSRDQFRRAWKDGMQGTAGGRATAEFTNHYHRKRDTCFYLLTVSSATTLKKMLFDIGTGELYGEFLGPAQFESPAAGMPETCRVESFYCASAREWDVLVAPYMEKE